MSTETFQVEQPHNKPPSSLTVLKAVTQDGPRFILY